MANKYHAIQQKNLLDRASDNSGVRFANFGEVTDYSATLRADAKKAKAERKKYKRK